MTGTGRRRWVIGGAFVLTLGAYLWLPVPDTSEELATVSDAALARVSRAADRPVRPAQAGPYIRELKVRTAEAEPAPTPSALGVPGWVNPAPLPPPPPAPLVTVAPPGPPQTPPLPFKVAGLYRDGDALAVFLLHNDRNIVVRAGDRIGADYRVDAIDETSLTLSYLPLNAKQSIEVALRKP